MFDWLWKSNRWFDDLEKRDMSKDRFWIFLAATVVVVFGPYTFLTFMYTNVHGIFYLVAMCTIILIPRMIWIESSTLGARFPSKY